MRSVGVEGTGAPGAGLARQLLEHGIEVLEVPRPDRRLRRQQGKSDPIDAEAAARPVLADNATVAPKYGTGPIVYRFLVAIAKAFRPTTWTARLSPHPDRSDGVSPSLLLPSISKSCCSASSARSARRSVSRTRRRSDVAWNDCSAADYFWRINSPAHRLAIRVASPAAAAVAVNSSTPRSVTADKWSSSSSPSLASIWSIT